MAQEEFEIEIGRDGKVKVRTKGIKGSRCLDFADLFVQIIGKEESRELTNEYYETDTQVLRHIEQKVKR
jgi:Protein of unknown function (DUF2997)